MKLNLPDSYNVSEVLFHNLEAGRGDKVAIYYGDETATLRGDESGDRANRQPMAWSRSANGGFTSGISTVI